MIKKIKTTIYSMILFGLIFGFLTSQAVAKNINTVDACKTAAKAKGLKLGGKGYAFLGGYRTKGCYSYSRGKYKGIAYFGSGGSKAQMAAKLKAPKYRISLASSKDLRKQLANEAALQEKAKKKALASSMPRKVKKPFFEKPKMTSKQKNLFRIKVCKAELNKIFYQWKENCKKLTVQNSKFIIETRFKYKNFWSTRQASQKKYYRTKLFCKNSNQNMKKMKIKKYKLCSKVGDATGASLTNPMGVKWPKAYLTGNYSPYSK